MDALFYESSLPTSAGMLHTLSADTARHAIQVLRLRQGDAIELTNGKGAYAKAVLADVQKKGATVRIESIEQMPRPLVALHIGIGMLKNASRLEWMLEKLTELGVQRIYLLQTKHVVKAHIKEERCAQILVSAMLQSRQCWLPVLQTGVSMENALAAMENVPQKYIAHCAPGPKQPLYNVEITHNNLAVLIGPEGDFSAEEIQLATGNQWMPASLGTTRLRTETAAICAAALVLTR